MTEQERRIDLSATDEPDGTSAYQASMLAPGESVRRSDGASDAGTAAEAGDDFGDDLGDADDDAEAATPSRAGYDVAGVSGDTDAVRPQ